MHYVSQLGSMDCGIACLTMILNYYGCKSDIVDIGAEIQIGRDSMTLAQMKKIAEKHVDLNLLHTSTIMKKKT